MIRVPFRSIRRRPAIYQPRNCLNWYDVYQRRPADTVRACCRYWTGFYQRAVIASFRTIASGLDNDTGRMMLIQVFADHPEIPAVGTKEKVKGVADEGNGSDRRVNADIRRHP